MSKERVGPALGQDRARIRPVGRTTRLETVNQKDAELSLLTKGSLSAT